MNIKDTAQLIGLGIGAYLLYRFMGQVKKIVDPVATVIADFWLWNPFNPTMVVQGNLAFADGSTVPLASVDIRQSPSGNVYASYSGHIYQLAPSDANGNWPATLVQ